MHRSLKDHKAYSSFIKHRDKALDTLLVKSQIKSNDILRHAFTRVIEIVSARYTQIPKDSLSTTIGRHYIINIQMAIDEVFYAAAKDITGIQKRLMKSSYILSKAGEGQALANVTGQSKSISIPKHTLDTVTGKTSEEHDVFDRTYLALSRITRDVMDALEMSRVRKEDTGAMVQRVLRVFPRSRRNKVPRRILKPFAEADSKPKDTVDLNLSMDDNDWNDVVTDYMDEYVPKHRSPEDVFDITPPGEPKDYSEEWYAWEGEQDVVNNFVQSVRDGTNDAAAQNGITDFVWVAIIDDRTDECCLWRDGKLMSEIEDEEASHDDGCEGGPPPLHFNCRCVLSPYLEGTPDAEPSNEEDFNQWLMS